MKEDKNGRLAEAVTYLCTASHYHSIIPCISDKTHVLEFTEGNNGQESSLITAVLTILG